MTGRRGSYSGKNGPPLFFPCSQPTRQKKKIICFATLDTSVGSKPAHIKKNYINMTEPEAEPSIEDVDDILYLARVNEAAELQCLLVEVCEKMKLSRAQLLAKAVEPESQNCALHYAAANGHTGNVPGPLCWITTATAHC